MISLSRRKLALLLLEAARRRRKRKHGGGPAVASASPAVYLSDTFTRANGAIGTAETGGAWTDASGTWIVTSNQAAVSSVVGIRVVSLDDLQADGTWSANMTTVGNMGIAYRRTDDLNFIYLASATAVLKLFRVTAGVKNTIGSGSGLIAGDKIEVRVSGNTHDVYLNGVLDFSATESQGAALTSGGMASQATAARVDNLVHQAT